jgi:hypothetical protein
MAMIFTTQQHGVPSVSPQLNASQHQAYKYLRQVYPYLDMALLATVAPWPHDKLIGVFDIWFPRRLGQRSQQYYQGSAHCYLCHIKKQRHEALDVTCGSCFNQLLTLLRRHPMVFGQWNPMVEAAVQAYLLGEANPQAADDQPLATQPQGQLDADTQQWLDGWLHQVAHDDETTANTAPTPTTAVLKQYGFVL